MCFFPHTISVKTRLVNQAFFFLETITREGFFFLSFFFVLPEQSLFMRAHTHTHSYFFFAEVAIEINNYRFCKPRLEATERRCDAD